MAGSAEQRRGGNKHLILKFIINVFQRDSDGLLRLNRRELSPFAPPYQWLRTR